VSEEDVTPRLFDHAVRVYEEMCKRSTKQVIEGEEVSVYEGHTTTLFSDLSIANPYYTKIMDALKGQNCLVQIRRGGGVALSKWIMLTPPTEDGFRAIMDRKRAPKGRAHILEQQVKGLTTMVNNLVERVEQLEKVK
jgi:hypothetical protein